MAKAKKTTNKHLPTLKRLIKSASSALKRGHCKAAFPFYSDAGQFSRAAGKEGLKLYKALDKTFSKKCLK